MRKVRQLYAEILAGLEDESEGLGRDDANLLEAQDCKNADDVRSGDDHRVLANHVGLVSFSLSAVELGQMVNALLEFIVGNRVTRKFGVDFGDRNVQGLRRGRLGGPVKDLLCVEPEGSPFRQGVSLYPMFLARAFDLKNDLVLPRKVVKLCRQVQAIHVLLRIRRVNDK